MEFLDKVDIEEKACNTVHKDYEELVHEALVRLWPERHRFNVSGKHPMVQFQWSEFKHVPSDVTDLGAVHQFTSSLKFADKIMDFELRDEFSETPLLHIHAKPSLFGKKYDFKFSDNILNYSPEYLDVALSQLSEEKPEEILNLRYYQANIDSQPDTFRFSKEMTEHVKLVDLNDLNTLNQSEYSIIYQMYGKFATATLDEYNRAEYAGIVFQNSEDKVFVFDTVAYASQTLNLMMDNKYISPQSQTGDTFESFSDMVTVHSLPEFANMMSQEIENKSFKNSLDDLKEEKLQR
jgi:hypothetical protein